MWALFFIVLVCNLIGSSYQDGNFIVAIGDSYTGAGSEGGARVSYPVVAANILNWTARNFAVGGSKMSDIPRQLTNAAASLKNATHVMFTTGGNDLGVADALLAVIFENNVTGVEAKITSLKPELVETYQKIKAAARPGTKIYAVPYVDFVSVGHKIPNEDSCHQVLAFLDQTVQDAATEAQIDYIAPVKGAFLGHEMFSADPYVSSFFDTKNAAHPNVQGYAKIGQVVAAYIAPKP